MVFDHKRLYSSACNSHVLFRWRLGERIHSQLSKVSMQPLDSQYFSFLANYKLAILVLNIVPYIALKAIA